MNLGDRIRRIARQRGADERGWFLKVIDGKEEFLPRGTGEFYVTMAIPGRQRGGHYHSICNEWFTVIQGFAEVILDDPATGERMMTCLSEEFPETLYVPAGVAHIFSNPEGSTTPFLLVAYADRAYDPEDTILYDFTVRP